MTNQTRILVALSHQARTDRQVAELTGLPLPSVRRTRLHLLMAGSVVKFGTINDGRRTEDLWAARQWYEMPNQYTGKQHR